MGKTDYAAAYRDIDIRQEPDRYVIGRGEQGVLIAQPYKSEILPFWRFATPEIAKASAEKIYQLFNDYKAAKDFVGMDMARKFLQMGWTRSRRYANHASGDKYNQDGTVKKQDSGSEQSAKAESARIFFEIYSIAKNDEIYLELKELHKQKQK
ncbi:DUF4385 domain-containing protein [Polaromonas sp.]|nr:DUF4385 domain-containing protein [Candidatus Saccharibacteria bacterium]